MTEDKILCRSKSPAGEPCAKRRGHREAAHQAVLGRGERRWRDGVRAPAQWFDSGPQDYSEAWFQAGGRW